MRSRHSKVLFALSLALGLVLLSLPVFADGLHRGMDTDATAADLLVPVAQTPSPQVQRALDALLYDYTVFDLPTAELDRRVREEGRVSIHLGNQTFELLLEPNDLRAEGYQEILMTDAGEVVLPERQLTTFRGTVVGDPDSIVRFSVLPDRFEGYIKTAQDWVFIDPVTNYTPAGPLTGSFALGAVIYRESDVRPDAMGKCGSGSLHAAAADLGVEFTAGLSIESMLEASHQRRNLQVATDGDGQLFQRYGNPGVFNFMSGVLNRVDGIYGGQLNLDVTIVSQQAWSSISGDPYTSLDAGTTLNELRNWWNANRGNVSRDTVHHFSGKNFNGGTVGIAWVGVICNAPSFSYGLSEDQRNTVLNGRLTAHELGHNLSASHDDQIGCATCNGTGPIMCSFIQSSGSDTFSSCSRNSIANHVHNNGFCM